MMGPGIGRDQSKTLNRQSVQFADRVSALRANADLTLEQAAELWGYSRGTILNWEAGRTEPKWSQWEEIEEAMRLRMVSEL